MTEERKKMNKIDIFAFGFLGLVILCFVFLGSAPIPYVQAAILNLPHPYRILDRLSPECKVLYNV